MIWIFIYIFFVIFTSNQTTKTAYDFSSDGEIITMSVSNTQKSQKIVMSVIMLDDEWPDFMEKTIFESTLIKDFSFTQQIEAGVVHQPTVQWPLSSKRMKSENAALLLYIKHDITKNSFLWYLYDGMSGSLIAEKKYLKLNTSPRVWAHAIADQVWSMLMGQEGFFSTKIAYCKDGVGPKMHKNHKMVCIADYDGSNEKIIVQKPTVCVAPRWNNDYQCPLLFYSEYTNNNMRLMVTDLNGKVRIASNFDGINMLPAFSADGKKAVYCASRGTGSCQLYYYEKDVFKKVTNNEGNNISPTLVADGTKFFFCSDFQTGYPQIYFYDIETGTQEAITQGGYCASPAYHQKTEKLVYSKMVNGTMQLMLYDGKTKKHTQLTFDQRNKQEASWSPCGNYLLFSCEQKGANKLALMNVHTRSYRFITDPKGHYTYPHWSPQYSTFPAA